MRELILLAGLVITACANSPVRDYPHGKRCETDGVHKHLTDKN